MARLRPLAALTLEPIRVAVGLPVVISSGWRCGTLNALMGGEPRSQHVRGEAADFEVPGIDNLDLAHRIVELKDDGLLDFDQLILEFYQRGIPDSGWIHISHRAGNNRGQVLQAIRVDGKKQYLSGLPARVAA